MIRKTRKAEVKYRDECNINCINDQSRKLSQNSAELLGTSMFNKRPAVIIIKKCVIPTTFARNAS